MHVMLRRNNLFSLISGVVMGWGLGIMMAGERKGIWNTCKPLPRKGQYMQWRRQRQATSIIRISISLPPAAACRRKLLAC